LAGNVIQHSVIQGFGIRNKQIRCYNRIYLWIKNLPAAGKSKEFKNLDYKPGNILEF